MSLSARRKVCFRLLEHRHEIASGIPWNNQESTLRLSRADVRLLTFLPYDLARLYGALGLFFGLG